MKSEEQGISCRLCGSNAEKKFRTKILNKYEVNYYHCSECALLQSEQPYWIEEAYQDAISELDTGIFLRNYDNVKNLTILLSSFNYLRSGNSGRFSLFRSDRWAPNRNEDSILDFGGGHGILVRLLRDVGFDAFWYDKYATNHFSKGFESIGKKYRIVLAYELFEHFAEPKSDISEILDSTDADILVFSTKVYGDTVPPLDWWYYSFQAGQHIAFYNNKVFKYIENVFKCRIYSVTDEFHIMTRNGILFNESKLHSIFTDSDVKFERAKRLYESKTFSDHFYMKKKSEMQNDNP